VHMRKKTLGYLVAIPVASLILGTTAPAASADERSQDAVTQDVTQEAQAASDLPALAALVAGGSFAAPANAATDGSTAHVPATSAAGTQCRNANVSTAGAEGSARICWTPERGEANQPALGRGPWYRATVKGTVKDNKADKQRAVLYVRYHEPLTVGDPPAGAPLGPGIGERDVATAPAKGRTVSGSWSDRRVRDVTIRVCTVGTFGNQSSCSRLG
jgi:hypothetical protein